MGVARTLPWRMHETIGGAEGRYRASGHLQAPGMIPCDYREFRPRGHAASLHNANRGGSPFPSPRTDAPIAPRSARTARPLLVNIPERYRAGRIAA